MVLPFIQSLGYDVFDPTEVVPEFTADYGLKSGEKVDYAIIRDNAPIMLFECKKVGDPLDSGRASQLARYFTNTPARIAILTDGIIYKFYSDLDAENAMDTQPFLEMDITKIDQRAMQSLSHFAKHSFNLDEVHSIASNMKHVSGMKSYLADMYSQPDEEFVRLLARKVFNGPLFQTRIEHFTGLTKLAFTGFVNDLISDTLQRASNIVHSEAIEDAQPSPEEPEEPEEDTEAATNRRSVLTTAEEIQGYDLVKAILADVVDPERVTMRDTQSYCGILLDDNNRRPICRLRFNNALNKRFVLMGQERGDRGQRIETTYSIETVNEITDYADQLREVVRAYLQEAEPDSVSGLQ